MNKTYKCVKCGDFETLPEPITAHVDLRVPNVTIYPMPVCLKCSGKLLHWLTNGVVGGKPPTPSERLKITTLAEYRKAVEGTS